MADDKLDIRNRPSSPRSYSNLFPVSSTFFTVKLIHPQRERGLPLSSLCSYSSRFAHCRDGADIVPTLWQIGHVPETLRASRFSPVQCDATWSCAIEKFYRDEILFFQERGRLFLQKRRWKIRGTNDSLYGRLWSIWSRRFLYTIRNTRFFLQLYSCCKRIVSATNWISSFDYVDIVYR